MPYLIFYGITGALVYLGSLVILGMKVDVFDPDETVPWMMVLLVFSILWPVFLPVALGAFIRECSKWKP